MQNNSIWALTALLGACVVGCNAAGGGSNTSMPSGTTGGKGSTGSGGSLNTGGLNIGPDLGTVDPTGGEVEDPDPGNPNIAHPKCAKGMCTDFPADPIIEQGVPANVATLFGEGTDFTAGSLCALEPQLSSPGKEGAMMPVNWVRPRFRVMAPAGIDLLEIRIHSPTQKNDLVAYTRYAATGGLPSSWYLPKEIWAGKGGDGVSASGNGFANNAAGQPVTVTIRGINSASPGKPVGVTGDFHIAPVVATGSMVFWTVNSAAVTPDSSKLLGFAVGDEGVADSLTLPQVAWAGEIGEDGAVLRGFYDMPKVAGFVDGQVRCIGCHTSLPDGSGVVFTDDWPWSKAAASLTAGSVGSVPTVIGAGAQAIMKMPWWGTQSLSPGHWTAGDRIMITTYGTTFKSGKTRDTAWQALPAYDSANPANNDTVKWHQLAWIDLESTAAIDVAVSAAGDYGSPALAARQTAAMAAKGTAWGIIATGDTGVSVASPNMSHKGDKIVYTTTDYSPDGHADATAKIADLKVVDYNNRLGGTAVPLTGAADPAYLEYYPSYSADDALIAFTRAPSPSAASPDGPYYNRFGQVMVTPADGSAPMPTALAANDPGTCGGDNMSTGIINSWPKWSPDAFTFGGKTYYFLVFSSARKYGDDFSQQFKLATNPLASFKGLTDSSQLYLAAVVVDNTTKAITTYPAVYIWNQNRAPGAAGAGAAGLHYSNLTPAWDPIKLPPLVIPEVRNDPPK
ncbi:MAG TPA: hypothetical protein VHP33_39770 [Polyangiaceae bacterium]|nr:hypothetical protein [Polyangiaceae bacterium]